MEEAKEEDVSEKDEEELYVCLYVCVCVRVRLCMCVRLCVRVRGFCLFTSIHTHLEFKYQVVYLYPNSRSIIKKINTHDSQYKGCAHDSRSATSLKFQTSACTFQNRPYHLLYGSVSTLVFMFLEY